MTKRFRLIGSEPIPIEGEWVVETVGDRRSDCLVLKVVEVVTPNSGNLKIEQATCLYATHRHTGNNFKNDEDFPMMTVCGVIEENNTNKFLQHFEGNHAPVKFAEHPSIGIFWIGYPEQKQHKFKFVRLNS